MKRNQSRKRYFYVVYFLDTTVQALLDAIRLLSNPQEKGRAHITVRGPYSRQQRFSKLGELLQGTEVLADGLGAFFEGSQNTVYIRCNSESIRKVWKKSDYGYTPHIALYDGDSREFAEQLLVKLQPALGRQFQIKADGLSPMLSQQGQRSCDLLGAFDSRLVSRILGRELEADNLKELSTSTRLDYIGVLAQNLGQYVRRNGTGAAHGQWNSIA